MTATAIQSQRPSTILGLTVLVLGVPAIARTGRLDVAPPVLSSITLAPSSIQGGTDVTGEVGLSGRAPAGGLVIQLSSSNPAVAHPSQASVTVPEGATTRGFTVTTVPVGQSTTVTIAAFADGVSKSALLNVQAVLSSVSLARASVRGGYGVGGVVRLFLPAPSGGLAVQLTSSNPAAVTVPASITVPAGATAGNFTALAIPVGQLTSVTITATVGGVGKTAQLSVEPPALYALTLGAAELQAGLSATGEVRLSGPAPSAGFAVTLSSSDRAVAAVPASVIVPGGATTVQFTYTADKVAKATTVRITASAAGTTRTRELTVNP
jgi:hypothetical protein